MRKNLFTILLCLTFLPVLPGMWGKLLFSDSKFPQINTEETLPSDTAADATETSTESAASSQDPVITESDPVEETIVAEAPKEFTTVDTTYWSDALFIGDSRTMGLSEYADLGDADVLASSGMSVYKVFSEKFSLPGREKQTLEEILSARQYGKIYITLGINELGYNFDRSVELYKEMVEKIQALQPDAILFLGANLHVTEEKSNSDPLFNNEAINRMNEAISALANQQNIFYVDVNVLFDDENGNLNQEYTGDAAHILGKYYAQWAEWLLTKGIE